MKSIINENLLTIKKNENKLTNDNLYCIYHVTIDLKPKVKQL